MFQFLHNFFCISIVGSIWLTWMSIRGVAQINIVLPERVPISHAISQNTILCIVQDRQGFMWFGTQDGLNKYDGYKFTVYKHDFRDANSLSDNYINTILEDQNGTLWIGTQNGLNQFDRDKQKFIRFQNNPGSTKSISHNNVSSIIEDNNGILWIGTHGGGVNQLDLTTMTFSHYRHNPTNPQSLSNDDVNVVYEDLLGKIWVATENGLNQFDKEKQIFLRYQNNPQDPSSISDNKVRCLFDDRSGNLWIGTHGGGLNRWDRKQKKFFRYHNDSHDANSISHNNVWSIGDDKTGTIWIGTNGGGLNQLTEDGQKFKRYVGQHENNLVSHTINYIYKDQTGTMWIAAPGGLYRLDLGKPLFERYQHSPNYPATLSHNVIWAIHADPAGELWVGTDAGGLNKFNKSAHSFTVYKNDPQNQLSLSNNCIVSIYGDKEGFLWVGTNGGLNKFNKNNGTFIRYQNQPDDPSSLSDNYVNVIYEDRGNTLWIGTYVGGLNMFDRTNGTFKSYKSSLTDSLSLGHNTIGAIYEDRYGNFWIGTMGGGLNKFDRLTKTFKRYRNNPANPTSISDNRVFCIYEDHVGSLWIGTYGGLNLMDRDSETFTAFTEFDGLPSNWIYGILEDDHDNLWLSTNYGISRFNLKNKTFRNYDVEDGLQSNEFNQGAYCKDKDGWMYFGGINGFNAFHPDSIKDNINIPPVVITDFLKLNQSTQLDVDVSQITHLNLSYLDYVFSFEFAALNYRSPMKNRYAYRMEGFDEDWIYTDATKRFATYTNLDPGHYAFKVKGSNNDGLWNEASTDIAIYIAPPFWRTWWFRSIAFIIVVGVIYAAVSYRGRRMLELERMRTKIAIDLHDHIGSGLTEITILSEVGLQQLGIEALHDKFKRISDTSRQLSQNMGDIVWLINPRYDSLGDIILQLKKSYEDILINSKINFRCSHFNEWNQFHLSIENRKHLYLVLKEAINNSLKHSGCNEIKLMFHYQSYGLEIIYEDNGKGFNDSDSSEGNGLPNMAHRIKLMGGQLDIDSVLGRGTRITMVFPDSKNPGKQWLLNRQSN